MDIDLFLTPYGECGLLCSKEFEGLPAGVIFDAETLELTAEFIETSPFHFNITVEEQLRENILFTQKLYLGFLEAGMIADTIEVPLLYLNDPYGSDFGSQKKLQKPIRSMVAFEQFMKRTIAAQPIHRNDLSDETSSGSVLKGMNPKQLEFVPQLIRQRMLELAPQGPAAPAATFTPDGPGMRGPGEFRTGRPTHIRKQPPRQKDSDQD